MLLKKPLSIFLYCGTLAWICCLLTLGYQGSLWLVNGIWEPFTLQNFTQFFGGISYTTLTLHLPLEWAAKIIYLLITIELALACWWVGSACFIIFALCKTLKK